MPAEIRGRVVHPGIVAIVDQAAALQDMHKTSAAPQIPRRHIISPHLQ